MDNSAVRAPAKPTHFHSGTAQHPVYVHHVPGEVREHATLPVVMLHGGFHTGAAYLSTPDGRPGWAQYFATRGHDVYVPDWPGHGRSRAVTPLTALSTRDVSLALLTLVRSLGTCIVFAHSAAGPIAWWIAEQSGADVAAIVGVAPGPPANILESLPDDPAAVNALSADSSAGCPVYADPDRPVSVSLAFIRQFWAGGPRFPKGAEAAYASTIVSESPRLLNERFNIGGTGLRVVRPEVVSSRPILIVTGELDPRHPKSVDAKLAEYLGAEFLWLPDAGCSGNGHMLMIEDNSDEIAGLIARWLERRGF